MSTEPRTSARRTFAPNTVDSIAIRTGDRTRSGGRAAFIRVRRELRPSTLYSLLVTFYREPIAWFGLVVSALILTYAGGAVMFWLHSIYLGEGGPAISPVAHWALDSTAGFVGLIPAVALIIPLAAWATTVDGRVRPAAYAVVGGALFALATAPGPVLHDALIGRGTWVADQVTTVIGSAGAPTAVATSQPLAVSIAWQVAVGLPTYTLLTWLSLILIRSLVHGSRSLVHGSRSLVHGSHRLR